MKTIKDAVIELGGKWPSEHQGCVYMLEFTSNKIWKCSSSSLGSMFSKSEFESCAKRLGYINGYRWGLEYPTSGKRPELADGTLVEARYPNGDWHEEGEDDVFDFLWKAFSHFRITDRRYKPDDTSYLNIQPQNHIVESNEMVANWHERGELPPVGSTVEIAESSTHVKISYPAGTKVKIYAHFTDDRSVKLAAFIDSLGKVGGVGIAAVFKPIRTHREKVIEAADLLIHSYQAGAEIRTEFLNVLYDAGMLVLPGANCNTKG